MRQRIQPSALLRDLAEAQGGVITRDQARQVGLGRNSQHRLISQGQWQIMIPGVLLTHDQEPRWEALAWAGVLKAGDAARLAGLAAAHLHKLVDDVPEQIDILHPHGCQYLSTEPWVFRQERPGVRRAGAVGSPPRTRIEDTVIDLCGTDLGTAAGKSPLHWITVSLQRSLTTSERLQRALDRRQRVAGRQEIKQLLDVTGEGVHSPLEFRYRRDVERAHALPSGIRQAPDAIGGRRNRRDVRYPEFRLLVELDGLTGHSGLGRFRDFRRDNSALLAGEVTLRYGWTDVRQEPCQIAVQVAEMLIRGGWTGVPTRCPRCPSTLWMG